MDDTFTTYLDWRVANLVGSNLLKTASCSWLRLGEDLAGKITLSIKAGTLSGTTATIVTTTDHVTHPRSYPTNDEFVVATRRGDRVPQHRPRQRASVQRRDSGRHGRDVDG